MMHNGDWRNTARKQRGIALLAVFLVIGAGLFMFYFSQLSATAIRLERNRVTERALAKAKEALIAYAVSAKLDITGQARPGDLPCPDISDSGSAGTSCSNAAGTTIGRLPWKKLGLEDLRDGYGERLWYAVANPFKNNPRVVPLNSDSRGTITVRDPAGNIVNDGTEPDPYAPSAAIAVILSAGPAMQRQDGLAQDRSCGADSTCQSTGVCSSPSTPKCNPMNYLDIALGEDNANFVDSNSNGFIQGDVQDSAGNVILNDRLAIVTYQELFPQLEMRVLREVRSCLMEYAAKPQNQGKYPWAADPAQWMTPPTTPSSYVDTSGLRFGRIADSFDQTASDSVGMDNGWTGSCILGPSGWWAKNQWNEFVFYGVADKFKPTALTPPACGPCITVNAPASVQVNLPFVVILAGKALRNVAGIDQTRFGANKANMVNYLEGGNATFADDGFELNRASQSFNDQVGLP
jgi:hypothetical protein